MRKSISGASWTITIVSHGQGAQAARKSASRTAKFVGTPSAFTAAQRMRSAISSRGASGSVPVRNHCSNSLGASIRAWAPHSLMMSSSLQFASGGRAMAC